jgi:type III pantothenate kinase
MILGILLGNSSLRYAAFDGAIIIEGGRVDWTDIDRRAGELRRFAERHRVEEAVMGSVRDDLLGRAVDCLPARVPAAVARRDFPLPIKNGYARPEEAGTDRLLNAIAARSRAKGAPAVVVDFGTAISISVVARDGTFLGGLIAAGARTMALGLAQSAPRLPAVEPAPVDGSFIRRDTVSALQAGVYRLVTGGVREMLRGVAADLAVAPVRVLATGGEAAVFAPGIPEIDEVVPGLGLEGLFEAHAAWRAAR